MKCLDENTIVEFLDGMLSHQESEAVEKHLDDCPACHGLLVEMVRTPGSRTASDDSLSCPTQDGEEEGASLKSGLLLSEQPGRYTILGEYGRGSQARVLVAFDKIIGREVALKEIIASQTDDDGSEKSQVTFRRTPLGASRFLLEAQIAGQLSHPNIVPVYEIGQRQDGRPYYTMLLVRGRTLAQALAECADLPARMRLLEHFLDLCHAIAYAHSRGVVHRDIKPHNVMVGEFGETILLDWGLAKVRQQRDLHGQEQADGVAVQDSLDGAQTIDGTVVGTPSYMSPEQAAGKIEEIDERSDVFSLGAVLYEILTGQPPFVGKSIRDVLEDARRVKLKPVRRLCPTAPVELAAVVQMALHPEKSKRYQSVSDMAEEISNFMTGGRVQAYAYSSWDLLKRFASAHKAAFIASSMIVMVILVALTLVSISLNAESTARDNEQEQRQVAQKRFAESQREGARADMLRGDLLESRAKLRTSMETVDSPAARGLWWQLSSQPEYWKKDLGSKVLSVDYSPDGHTIAAGCINQSIYLIDVLDRQVRVLRGQEHTITNVSFSPDNLILASGDSNGLIRLWTLKDGSFKVLRGHARSIAGLAFSPNGQWLASVSQDKTVRIWEVDSGRELLLLQGHTHMPSDLAFRPDGKMFATGGFDGSIRFWEVSRNPDSAKQVAMLSVPNSYVYSVAYSPDQKYLASCHTDNTIRIWDLESNTVQRVIRLKAPALDVKFLADGKSLVSAGRIHNIDFWDVESGRWIKSLDSHEDTVYEVALSPDNRFLVSGSMDLTVRLWDLGTPDPSPVRSAGHKDLVNAVEFSPDGRTIASGSYDQSVILWDVATGSPMRTLVGHRGAVRDVAFSLDGRQLASASTDGTIRIWEVETGAWVRTLSGHGLQVGSVAYSPDGKVLASSGNDGTIRIWDSANGNQQKVFSESRQIPKSLAISPDGKVLASAGTEAKVVLCDLQRGVKLRTHQGLSDTIQGITFCPDSSHLVSTDSGGNVFSLDVMNGNRRALAKFEVPAWGVECHPKGRLIGLGLDDGTARILDLHGKSMAILKGHQRPISSLVFSPDGLTAATAGDDGTVRLWEVETGRPLWRASMLLLEPPALLTHQGWKLLGTPGGTWSCSVSWCREVEKRSRYAVENQTGNLVCMWTYDDFLELWDKASDRVLTKIEAPGIAQLLGVEAGCLFLQNNEVRLLDASGLVRTLQTSVRAMSFDQGQILMAQQQKIMAQDFGGVMREEYPGQVGVTALARCFGELYAGFIDGNIQRISFQGQRQDHPVIFEDVSASPVERMIPGPPGTIVVGYSNGFVGIWSLADGVRLGGGWLHGPVTRILYKDSMLFATTELGAHLTWDLRVFDLGYCDLMRTIWRAVLVRWEEGMLVSRPPQADHGCFAGMEPAVHAKQ